MSKFCPSCGIKITENGTRFCPECGAKQPTDTPDQQHLPPPPPDQWDVVVGDINHIPPPPVQQPPPPPKTPPALHRSPADTPPPAANRIAPSLVPPAIAQLLSSGWVSIQALSSYDESGQPMGVIVLLLALVSGICGLAAGRSRGAASVIALITAIFLALIHGTALVFMLLLAVQWGGFSYFVMPAVVFLIGLVSSFATALVALKKAK